MLREIFTLIKAIGGSHNWRDERDGQLDTIRLDSWDVNISFYLSLLVGHGGKVALQHIECNNIVVVKGFEVTLDDIADLHKDPNE